MRAYLSSEVIVALVFASGAIGLAWWLRFLKRRGRALTINDYLGYTGAWIMICIFECGMILGENNHLCLLNPGRLFYCY
jgi:hypothetical protein